MIGYYVHHHGAGHSTRATAVARALATATGEEVVGLSSLPRPGDWPTEGPGAWVELPDDTDGLDPAHPEPHHEVTAGGALHFAPLATGFSHRQARIARWVAEARPRLVVVDVSVEAVALLRLLGVPVVTVAMPGDRTDPAHRLGYALASAIIACWPEGAHPDHVVATDPALAARTRYVGGVSRAPGEGPNPAAPRDPHLGVVLWGRGGDAPQAPDLAALADADPSLHWHRAHDLDPEELWPLLGRAAVVVTHAGQGAVADVAATGAPAVVLARARPHDEQVATVRALRRLDLAATGHGWPSTGGWSLLLDEARHLGGDRWQHWLGDGAAGIAELLSTTHPGEDS